MGLREMLANPELRSGIFILFATVGFLFYTLAKFASVLASHGIL